MKYLLILLLMTSSWLCATELSLPLQALINRPSVDGLLQQNSRNYALVHQLGSANQAEIVQAGGVGNLVILTQTGWQQRSTLNQQGNGNTAIVTQIGSGNASSVTQTGRGNLAINTQITDNSDIGINQTGNFNKIIVNDFSGGGTPLEQQFNQTGSFRTVIVNHY